MWDPRHLLFIESSRWFWYILVGQSQVRPKTYNLSLCQRPRIKKRYLKRFAGKPSIPFIWTSLVFKVSTKTQGYVKTCLVPLWWILPAICNWFVQQIHSPTTYSVSVPCQTLLQASLIEWNLRWCNQDQSWLVNQHIS